MKQKNSKLTDEQESILFNKATEAAFSGNLLNNKDDGVYKCANCHAVVFESESKFDSGSGWPSFYKAIDSKSVKLAKDTSLGMERVEVSCVKCGGHLGHVFSDGYGQPGGKRYCINSLSLDFSKKD